MTACGLLHGAITYLLLTMPTRGKYYKVSYFLKKKPGISDEEFHAHWEGVHKDLPQRIPKFMKIVKRYQQVCPR